MKASMKAWALKKDGKVLATHPHRSVCVTEAYERGLVLHAHADFLGDKDSVSLAEGVEITEIREEGK